MAKNILCLTGWGQKADSLEFIFQDPAFDPFFVSSFDYSTFGTVDDFFAAIAAKKTDPEIIIGWSLGGQLALRLIEKKILAPKLLILIAPPFQMVKDARISAGMARTTYEEFHKNFSQAPDKTLKQFSILTAMNDRNASDIARHLDIRDDNFTQLKFWLEELSRFSCFNLDFSNMPRTLFIQGAGDMIVHANQAQYFKNYLPNCRLEIFPNCGHAPHLNDAEHLRKLIVEEINFLRIN